MGGTTLQDNLRVIVSRVVEEAARNAGTTRKSVQSRVGSDSGGPLSGRRGVLIGAGAAALAPVALRGVGKLAKGATNGIADIAAKPARAVEKLGGGVGGAIGDKVSEKVDEAGGAAGIVKQAAKSALPFGGGGDKDSKQGVAGVGKGRRMPVQQSVDIGAPLETVYNQWTQFEQWPQFMHRVTRVTQEDDCTVSFATKIWGKTKEFKASIETQRPDERIKWRVSEGMTHTGVVTFHELGPRLTRVMLSFDVEPGGLLEKAARGMRHIKRAARADLHRFKSYVEMHERETGAWRGVIEDGELVEDHDPSYDEKREYFEAPGSNRRSRTRKRRSSGNGTKRSSGGSKSASSGRQASKPRSRQPSARTGSSSSARTGSNARSRGGSSSPGRSGSSRSPGRSSNASSRSGSATRSRAQASRSNGRG